MEKNHFIISDDMRYISKEYCNYLCIIILKQLGIEVYKLYLNNLYNSNSWCNNIDIFTLICSNKNNFLLLNGNKYVKIPMLYQVIKYAFAWNESKEGFRYWQNIDNYYISILNKKLLTLRI